MMEAIIFALIAYFAWGVGILFEAIAAKKFESKSFIFWGMLLGFFLSIFYAPFALDSLKNVTLNLLAINLVVAFFFIGGTLIYYEALKQGSAVLIGTIASSFPVVIVILSLIFFKEIINLYQALAIVTIFLGLILSSVKIKDLIGGDLKISGRGVALALLTMLSWGITMTLIRIPISKIGWYWPTLFVLSLFPVFYLYMRLTKTKLELPRQSSILVPAVVSILLVRIAEFSYSIGISKGMASVVAPIAGANPTLFILLAFFVFKDRLSKQQIIGIIITVAGIVALSLLSI